jgi:hypothetical protein
LCVGLGACAVVERGRGGKDQNRRMCLVISFEFLVGIIL